MDHDYSTAESNKAKIRIFSYSTLLIGAVLVGLVVANVMMFNVMYKQFDEVGVLSYIPCSFIVTVVFNLVGTVVCLV